MDEKFTTKQGHAHGYLNMIYHVANVAIFVYLIFFNLVNKVDDIISRFPSNQPMLQKPKIKVKKKGQKNAMKYIVCDTILIVRTSRNRSN